MAVMGLLVYIHNAKTYVGPCYFSVLQPFLIMVKPNPYSISQNCISKMLSCPRRLRQRVALFFSKCVQKFPSSSIRAAYRWCCTQLHLFTAMLAQASGGFSTNTQLLTKLKIHLFVVGHCKQEGKWKQFSRQSPNLVETKVVSIWQILKKSALN